MTPAKKGKHPTIFLISIIVTLMMESSTKEIYLLSEKCLQFGDLKIN
jgi:hypothetical protein